MGSEVERGRVAALLEAVIDAYENERWRWRWDLSRCATYDEMLAALRIDAPDDRGRCCPPLRELAELAGVIAALHTLTALTGAAPVDLNEFVDRVVRSAEAWRWAELQFALEHELLFALEHPEGR